MQRVFSKRDFEQKFKEFAIYLNEKVCDNLSDWTIKGFIDIKNENGIFRPYGEKIFDDYWMNYGKISIPTKDGNYKKITKLKDFLKYRGII